jgi:hypothetical protein
MQASSQERAACADVASRRCASSIVISGDSLQGERYAVRWFEQIRKCNVASEDPQLVIRPGHYELWFDAPIRKALSLDAGKNTPLYARHLAATA